MRYLQEQKFGGAFVWALDLDDFAGRFCGEGSHPLLSHLHKLLEIGKSKATICRCFLLKLLDYGEDKQ